MESYRPKHDIGFVLGFRASSIRSVASDSHHRTILLAPISRAFFVGKNLRVCLSSNEEAQIEETMTNYFRERQFR
jgi:hypothetical protein